VAGKHLKLAVGTIWLLATFVLDATAAAEPCGFYELLPYNIAPTKGQIFVELFPCPIPASVSVKLSKMPDMSSAQLVVANKIRESTPRDSSTLIALADLEPETTYFYRVVAQSRGDDRWQSTIAAFRTPARSAVHLPECRHRGLHQTVEDGRAGVLVEFECNGYWYLGDITLDISTEPDMNGARPVGHAMLIEPKTGFFEPAAIFLAYDDYPGTKTAYVQAKIENNVGSSRTAIIAVPFEKGQP
jgi:hypothetical protein